MQQSPILFVKMLWGLVPERDNTKFIKGQHITWQQHDILLAIERALRGEAPRKISVASGHGIGKSCVFSWIILWYLFCHKDAQVSCTAPTTQQIYDVLWKEVNLWLFKMPKEIQDLYEWSTTYVRIKERAQTWFARAATSRKEAPEAFAGIHGDHILLAGDEASGIPDEIFESGRGALTNDTAFVLLFGNPLRLQGYFYESQTSAVKNWQAFQFSSLDSPLISKESQLIREILEKDGEDSDQWRVRVLGQFPKADAVDKKGYLPLLNEADLRYAPDQPFTGSRYLGVDPSGEGSDKTAWVGRDTFIAKILGEEAISNEKTIASKTIKLMDEVGFKPENVTLDDFGVGSKVAREIYMTGNLAKVNPLNVGEKPEDQLYLNKRAEMFFRLRKWLRSGGSLVKDPRWKELLNLRYRAEENGKLRIMSKRDMAKDGLKSPNFADALALTFCVNDEYDTSEAIISMPTTSFYRR